MELKRRLFEACSLYVDQKLNSLEEFMNANRQALEQESKSSAGDKHETGRAMLHLEMEKAAQQFEAVSAMKILLAKIDPASISEKARLGSLVRTDQVSYYISISAGPITAGEELYYAVSPASPAGKSLLGAVVGDEVRIGPRSLKILSVR